MKTIVALAGLAMLAAAVPAQAECFEGVGCTQSQRFTASNLRKLNCGNLWFLRNAIYADNGFCFKTDQAISAFGNDGCRYWNANSVPLNAYERHNIAAIRKMERAKGC